MINFRKNLLFQHFITADRIVEEELRDFFPLPRVVTAVFGFVQNLFDITIQEIKDPDQVNAWNPDVKLFEVSDKDNGEIIGHFYFDPYMRFGS